MTTCDGFRYFLAYGDIWHGDAVELNEESAGSWIPVSGDIQHEDAGGVKFSVFLTGDTWDDVVRKWSHIENYLRRAKREGRYSPGVVLIEAPSDASEWTYRDVLSNSTITPVPMSEVAPPRHIIRGNLALTCSR